MSCDGWSFVGVFCGGNGGEGIGDVGEMKYCRGIATKTKQKVKKII